MKSRETTHARQYLLIALTASFAVGSASVVAAQPMPGEGQKHQGQQEHQGHDMNTIEAPAT